jgi:hypothetical protein
LIFENIDNNRQQSLPASQIRPQMCIEKYGIILGHHLPGKAYVISPKIFPKLTKLTKNLLKKNRFLQKAHVKLHLAPFTQAFCKKIASPK